MYVLKGRSMARTKIPIFWEITPYLSVVSDVPKHRSVSPAWLNSQLYHDPSKRRDVAAQRHGVTSQETEIFSNTPMRTSSLERCW